MSDVDIHILTTPGRGAWLSDLLSSLDQQPCRVHLADAIPDRIGLARASAFRLGDAELVGYADDDDVVEPGAVQSLLDALQARPDAVGAYTDEVLIDERGSMICDGASTGVDYCLRYHLGSLQHVHHLWIGRRSAAAKYLDDVQHMMSGEHWALTCLMRLEGPWIHVPMVGYRWRQHHGGLHARTDQSAVKVMARKIVSRWIAAGITTPESMPRSLVESGLKP